MPARNQQRKKRPTQSKTKGCYECSQRRISCDRSQPDCVKCVVRGIKCSGLNVRYRFEKGIASRGRFVGKTAQEVCTGEVEFQIPGHTSSQVAVPSEHGEASKEPVCSGHKPGAPCIPTSEPPSAAGALTLFQEQTLQGILIDSSYLNRVLQFDPYITLPAWKRSFLTHYSTKIAPHMLSIDDASNGWRHIVLPLSIEDEVVLHAVISASAYHVSSGSQMALNVGHSYFTKAVNGLLRRRDLEHHEAMTNGSTVVAILVLLVADMIVGCLFFPTLFKMLKSAHEAVENEGGSGDECLDAFLDEQLSKWHVYGEPLISEAQGIEIIASRAEKSFGCLKGCLQRHPQEAQSLLNIKSQIEQAYHIYLRRACNDLDPQSSFKLVEQFKSTAETYPCSTPGHQVLIWATFIVAAESSVQEHREFFTRRLKAFHTINKFQNCRKAVTLLKALWRIKPGFRWTTALPEMQIFVI